MNAAKSLLLHFRISLPSTAKKKLKYNASKSIHLRNRTEKDISISFNDRMGGNDGKDGSGSGSGRISAGFGSAVFGFRA